MIGGILRSFGFFLATFGVAWGIGAYRLRTGGMTWSGEELLLWLGVVPAVALAALLVGRWSWQTLRARRAARAQAAAQQAQDDARQAAEAQARQTDRRFDALAIGPGGLLLPSAAYMTDFYAALADAVPSAVPTEIDYDGEIYTLMARRIPDLEVPEDLECFHARTRRIAALAERLISSLELDRIGHATETGRPKADALTPFWERQNDTAPPQLVFRLLLDPALIDDARLLQAYLETRRPDLSLPAGWRVTIETKLADGIEALRQIDELISAGRETPDRAYLLVAAHSQFDDEFLRERLAHSQSPDPGQWQYRTRAIPSEGAAAVLLLPPRLAESFNLPVAAHLKRPVAIDTTQRYPEREVLHAALLRAAPDFDTPAPPAARVWFDADVPDAAWRRALVELNRLARPAAVAAFRAPEAIGEEEEVVEPVAVMTRRVFGNLGAVSALGLIASVVQQPVACSLIVVPDGVAAAVLGN